MPFKPAYNQEIFKKALKNQKLELVQASPKRFYARDRVHIKCTKRVPSSGGIETICGNKLNRHRKKWELPIWDIINKKINCSKCTAKNQTKNRSEFVSELSQIGLQLISAKNYKQKTKIKVKCKTCATTFPSSYDALFSKNSRACSCDKSVKDHFEKLVRTVFSGKKIRLETGIVPDCLIEEAGVIIDAKYGRSIFNDYIPGSNERSNQALRYLATGRKVYFICCLPKRLAKKDKMVPGVNYVFLEDFADIKINGRQFNVSQIKKAWRMYNDPYSFHSQCEPEDYPEVRTKTIEACKQAGNIIPTQRNLEKSVGYSFQKIKDVFGIRTRGDIMSMLAKKIAILTGSKTSMRTELELRRQQSLLSISNFVQQKYSGTILSKTYDPRKPLKFRCTEGHEFTHRSDAITGQKQSWCRVCKNKLKLQKFEKKYGVEVYKYRGAKADISFVKNRCGCRITQSFSAFYADGPKRCGCN